METTDAVLLSRWSAQRDAEAMAELVRRYAGLAYGAAFRILRDDAAAQDTAQDCFVKLTEVKAAGPSIAGLLHTMATNLALNRVRAESRRRAREQAYVAQQAPAAEISWNDLQEYVDEAIASLPEAARIAVVRHFLQGETHEAIALDEGVTRAAISKRIGRALEDVRAHLAKRGVAVGGAALGASLAANAAQAAPASLIAALGKWAMAGGGSAAVATGAGIAMGAAWKIAAGLVLLGGAMAMIASTGDTTPPEETPMAVAANDTDQDEPPEAEPAPAPKPDSNAFAVALGVPAEEGVHGVMLSETGHPRGGVEIFPLSDLMNYRRVEDDTGFDGKFRIADWKPNETQWLAQSRATHRAAVFEVASPTDTVTVVLDLHRCTFAGRVVDPSGAPVPKAHLVFEYVFKDGTRYALGDVQNTYTDATGYFLMQDGLARAGLRVRPGVALPDSDERVWGDEFTIDRPVASYSLPDVSIDASSAKRIAASALPDRVARYLGGVERMPYGGIVVDELGAPVAYAEVNVIYPSKPGFVDGATVSTDEHGVWTVPLPTRLVRVDVRVSHPDFVSSALSGEGVHPPLARLQDGTSLITVERGIPVTGRVLDEGGKGVADVLVLPRHASSTATTDIGNIPVDDAVTTRTDESGAFTLRCLPEGERDVLFLHPQFAPYAEALVVTPPEMGALRVELSRGSVVRGRIIDEAGMPVEGVRVSGEQWGVDSQQYIFPLNGRSDSAGVFEVRHVPAEGAIQFYFAKSGYFGMNANQLAPQEAPYEITLYKAPLFEGTVVDAATGTPIPDFEVNAGWSWDGGDQFYFDRMGRASEIHHPEGRFKKKVSGVIVSYPVTSTFAVKVSAEGYYNAQSEAYTLGTPMEPITLKLKKGESWTGRVTAKDGTAVSRAMVCFVAPGEIANVQNGLLNFEYANAPDTKTETDDQGAFSLQPTEETGALLALHESGYAYVDGADFVRGSDLALTPWARVEGQVVLNQAVEGDAPVAMQAVEAREKGNAPLVSWSFFDATHIDGRFEFDFVPSIPLQVGRWVAVARKPKLSHGAFVTPQPGTTHVVIVGGDGALAHGVLDFGESTFLTEAFAPEHVHAVAASVGGDHERHYVASIDDDRLLSIEGLPPGDYTLTVELHAPPLPNVCGAGLILTQDAWAFTLPEDSKGDVDLGAFALRAPNAVMVGDTAPDLLGFDFEGKEFSLAKRVGKPIVLDFWASWCRPCRQAAPKTEALREQYGKHGIQFVGVNFDRVDDAAERFAEANGMDFTQVHAGDWGENNPVLRDFTVSAIPSLWLIDKTGRVLARDLTPEKLAALLEQVEL